MINDEIFNKIKIFIAEREGRDIHLFTRETKLYYDLGIYGDDAVELIIAYGKKFNVDVSKFMLADYFKGEGFKIFGVEKQKKMLTIGHLEKGIIAKRLDDEVINS